MEIVVADTGCGIPSEKLESIFREFEQVEVTSGPPIPSQGLGKCHRLFRGLSYDLSCIPIQA